MDASIAAPRIIGGDIQKFFVSSNLFQDGSDRLFLSHIMIIAFFRPNACLLTINDISLYYQ